MSEPAGELLRATVADWDGTAPSTSRLDQQLAGASAADRPAVRLALLAFGATTVVDRIEEAVALHQPR